MTKPEIAIKSFSTMTLVHLRLRSLWSEYDGGGHSVGRSLRSRLLECFTDLTPFPEFKGSSWDYSPYAERTLWTRPLHMEVRKRIRLAEIPHYDREELGLAALGTLLAYEWRTPADVAWRQGFEWERKRLHRVLLYVPYLVLPSNIKIEDAERALLTRRTDIEFADAQIRLQQPFTG